MTNALAKGEGVIYYRSMDRLIHPTPAGSWFSQEINMNNLKIAAGSDFYKTPCIVDADSGKPVRFEAHQVPGKGWTVAKVTGSKRTGRTIEAAEGFETIDSYTMHQAQMAAENLTRDTFRALAQA